MALQTIPNDVYVDGNLSSKTFTPASGSIGNSGIAALAGIAATKLQKRTYANHAQVHGSAATSQRIVIHRVKGATGTINSFKCLTSVQCVGAATISVQLKKNGSNILSSATVLDSTSPANFVIEDAAGFTSQALVQGDVLEADITATAGGGTLGQGFYCVAEIDEDAV